MAYEKIAGKMPLWFFFFIASAGLSVILSFPFDIFVFDSSKTNALPMSFQDLQKISDALNDDFKPFTMMKYLGSEFPVGLAKIILVSLVVGTFLYLFYDAYQDVNGRMMRGRVRRKLEARALSKSIMQAKQFKVPKTKDYVKWLRSVDQWGYLDFIGSMKMLTEGLFFGAETFCMLNVVRLFNLMLRFFLGISISMSSESFLWFIWSVLIVGVTYAVYVLYYSTFKRTTYNLISGYKSDEMTETSTAHDSETEQPKARKTELANEKSAPKK